MRRDVSGDIRGRGGAGGADGGVRIPETADDGGDHLGEVRRERVAVVARHERQDGDALFPHRRFPGGVRVVDAAEEGGEGVVSEASGDGVELGGGES